MESMESNFNELGIDAVTGIELMEWLGISPYDFSDPSRFMKFKSVIDYFKQFPTDTQRYLIKKAVNNKNVDKLQHIFEYSQLLQQKEMLEKNLENVRSEGSALTPETDAVLRMANAERELDVKGQLQKISDEIRIYTT